MPNGPVSCHLSPEPKSESMAAAKSLPNVFLYGPMLGDWLITYIFRGLMNISFCYSVHEDTTLCSVIGNHLNPSPWNNPLRRFCEEKLDCLKFFIRKYPKVVYASLGLLLLSVFQVIYSLTYTKRRTACG